MIRLANSPMPHVTSMSQSVLDMFRVKSNSNLMHRSIPAPEPNPAPDGDLEVNHFNILPDDWDELFHAVQTRLENCVEVAFSKASELPLHENLAVIKADVLDCVASLRQLHDSLILERQAYQKR